MNLIGVLRREGEPEGETCLFSLYRVELNCACPRRAARSLHCG
jgi:hypothetical protein